MNTALLISPEAKSAYFQSYLDVAAKELLYVCGDVQYEHRIIGEMDFFFIDGNPKMHSLLARLSFVLGIFAVSGSQMIPIEQKTNFVLHEDFVFGSKYKGKTNERLTQLLLNVGLATIASKNDEITIFDPMAGRGTTLFWAMRYGYSAYGTEIDPLATIDVQRHIKKWTKIHRQKHVLKEGFLGVKPNKKKEGVHIHWRAEQKTLDFVHANSYDALRIFREKQFSLLVSDIPYGVQHLSAQGSRNPLQNIQESIPFWRKCLSSNGAIVLSFNRNLPKRDALVEAFEKHDLHDVGFSAPHRMSESIIRDIAIFVPK